MLPIPDIIDTITIDEATRLLPDEYRIKLVAKVMATGKSVSNLVTYTGTRITEFVPGDPCRWVSGFGLVGIDRLQALGNPEGFFLCYDTDTMPLEYLLQGWLGAIWIKFEHLNI